MVLSRAHRLAQHTPPTRSWPRCPGKPAPRRHTLDPTINCCDHASAEPIHELRRGHRAPVVPALADDALELRQDADRRLVFDSFGYNAQP